MNTPTETPSILLRSLKKLLRTSNWESALNRVELSGDIPTSELTSEFLERIKVARLRTRIEFGESNWELIVNIDQYGVTVYREDGDPEQFLDPDSAAEVRDAIAKRDLAAVLRVTNFHTAKIALTYLNEPVETGFNYIENASLLLRRFGNDDWHLLAVALWRTVDILIVEDLVAEWIQCGGVLIRGPITTPQDRLGLLVTETRSDDERPIWPPADYFYPYYGAEDSVVVGDLMRILRGLSRAISWYWLASSVSVERNKVSLVFSAGRVVKIDKLIPIPISSCIDDLELYRWTFSQQDPARVEAVRQSASLTLAEDTSFADSAATVHRTAESIYTVSQKGAIAEAMATRRAARQAALTVATDVSKAARESSGKSVDKMILQLGAGTAIVIVNAKDLVSTPVAVAVLVTLVFVAFASWLVSAKVEIESSEDALRAISVDLLHYRESLSRQDVDLVRNMQMMISSRKYVARAKKLVLIFPVVVALAAIIAIVAILIL